MNFSKKNCKPPFALIKGYSFSNRLANLLIARPAIPLGYRRNSGVLERIHSETNGSLGIHPSDLTVTPRNSKAAFSSFL
jgi:hypothetical protein